MFEVIEEKIFLAGAGRLNDPDEGCISWEFNGSDQDIHNFWVRKLALHAPTLTKAEVEKEARRRTSQVIRESKILNATVQSSFKSVIDDLVRMACFTTEPLNSAMWSHYATWEGTSGIKEHGGICIEYHGGKSWRSLGLHPVSYGNRRPKVNILSSDRTKRHQLAKALLVKSSSWRYEQEWRAVAYLTANPPFPANLEKNSKFCMPGAVRAVIAGLNATKGMVCRIEKLMKRHGCSVPLRKVERDTMTQELVIVDL
jgi:hypothetical protein